MILTDEDALICDFAETYNVLDYRALPLRTAATLASGLRADARIFESLKKEQYKEEHPSFETSNEFEKWRHEMMDGD